MAWTKRGVGRRRPRRVARLDGAGTRRRRHSSRNAPRLSAVPGDRPVADAGQRRRRPLEAVIAGPPPAPRPLRARARSRPARRGHGRSGSPHGSGVGARTPQRGGVEARGQVAAGTVLDSDRQPDRPTRYSRAQSARVAVSPLTRWWMPAMRVLGRAARRSPRRRRRRTSASPTRRRRARSGSPAARGPVRGREDLRREVVAGRAEQPGRPDDPEARRRRARHRRTRRRRALAGELRRAVRVDRRRAGRRGRSPTPSVRVAVEDLVRRDHRRGRCRARRTRSARTPVAVAVPGERAAPGRGRSRRRRSRRRRGRRPRAGRGRAAAATPSGASRSKSRRVQAIGPPGPVNGASSSASTSADPSRPLAPVTATRIRLGRAEPGPVLALVVGVPVADLAARHHASFATYQSTVAASPSSNGVRGRQPSAASFEPSIA